MVASLAANSSSVDPNANQVSLLKGSERRSASPAKRSAADMDQDHPLSQDTIANEDTPPPSASPPPYELANESHFADQILNDQIARVKECLDSEVSDGDEGYIVSNAWLHKILARASATAKHQTYHKDCLVGPIGPVDNTVIVPPDAFHQPPPFFGTNVPFISLRPGVLRQQDYEVLPGPAWAYLMQWYGLSPGQRPIVRFAHNTAASDAPTTNVEYELFPLSITIQRVKTSQQNASHSPTNFVTFTDVQTISSDRTDMTNQRAARLIASRQDKFQPFLAAAKTAAGIPMTDKVRTWRRLEAVSDTQLVLPGISSTSHTQPAVAITQDDFMRLEEGKHYEMINVNDETHNPKYNGHSQLSLFGIVEDQILILEPQVRAGREEYVSDTRRKLAATNHSLTKSTASGSSTPSGPFTRSRARRNGRPRGSIGLSNLGNTCYMNSALQCISRIEELAVYFLDSDWKSEINHDNPLGYSGRMAKAYGEFLSGLYQAGAGSAYRPASFKSALSYAQPMFSGYGQQDSQEFLSFLVDALHEDLNRIQKKPYMQNPDSDDTKVHDPEYIRQLGETYRANHRARNDSIAMDLFNGFYKNTMVCPTCEKVSVTFDPYSLLTLQLPVENTWQHDVFLIPSHGRPSRHLLDMDKNASIKTLKRAMASKAPDLDVSRLIVVETFGHKIYKTFNDAELVHSIVENDVILAIELPEVPTNLGATNDQLSRDMDSSRADCMAISVRHRLSSNGRPHSEIGQPLVVTITRDEATDYDAIMRKILSAVAKTTSKGFTTTISEQAAFATDDTLTPTDGGVSDESVPSEEGYVNISSNDSHSMSELLSIGETLSPMQLSMFDMRYAEVTVGNSLGYDRTFEMRSRVQSRQVRRDDSSDPATSEKADSSDHESSVTSSRTSSRSRDAPAGSSPPEIVLGGDEHRFHFSGDVVSDEEQIPSGAPLCSSTMARRKKGLKTYGRRRQNKNRADPNFRKSSSLAKSDMRDDDVNPYYIRLDEGIVLDWTEDAWDMLFAGSPQDLDHGMGYPLLDAGNLEVTKDPALEAKTAKRSRRRQEGVTLDECFAETAKTETLSEENAWYCSRCKELRLADKTLEIWTVPDILVIHLKRFSGERYRRDKVDIRVDFPIEGLDLSNRVGHQIDAKECMYDLFAVDNHYGGLGGGHYTATAKNFFDDKWYDFNDNSVSPTSAERAVTPAAYLLFYRRRSAEPLGPPSLRELVENVRSETSASGDESLPAGGVLLGDRATDYQASSRQLGPLSSDGTRAGPAIGPAAQVMVGVDQESPTLSRGNEVEDEGIGMNFDEQTTSGPEGRPTSNSVQLGPVGGWNFDNIRNEGLDIDVPADIGMQATFDEGQTGVDSAEEVSSQGSDRADAGSLNSAHSNGGRSSSDTEDEVVRYQDALESAANA